MPTILTSFEQDNFKNGSCPFQSIDDFRSFATSARGKADVEFLCHFLDADDPVQACRALTAMFYFGGILGIGKHIEKWFGARAAGSDMVIFAPAVARQSILDGADATALAALRRAPADPVGYPEVLSSLHQIDETFPPGSAIRRSLDRGELWKDARYLVMQLDGAVEARTSSTRIVYYLKAFPGSEAAYRAAMRYVGSSGVGVTAARVIVGFLQRDLPPDTLAKQPVGNNEDAIVMADVALTLFRRTGNRRYYDVSLQMEKLDSSGRSTYSRIRIMS